MKPDLLKMSILASFVFSLLFTALGYSQEAETAKFPSRPVTFIIPLPPGGPGDLSFRFISKAAEKYLGQPIALVNKPGGTLTIGIAAIAAPKPATLVLPNWSSRQSDLEGR